MTKGAIHLCLDRYCSFWLCMVYDRFVYKISLKECFCMASMFLPYVCTDMVLTKAEYFNDVLPHTTAVYERKWL